VCVLYLLGASVLWAFSFGLIKGHLTELDPWFVAGIRLALAAAVFLPWALRRRPPRGILVRAVMLGGLQFGLMYASYVASFRYLPAYGVALWTVFTPLYVVLLDGGYRRRFGWRAVSAAILAVAGAAVVVARNAAAGSLPGILLVQGSNLCFAAGQLAYPRLASRVTSEAGLLGWMYIGAAVVAGAGTALAGGPAGATPDAGAWLVLAYLGLVPTALGFALWNHGATRASSGILATSNNLKVPLAVLVSWFVFGESANRLRTLAGLGLMIGALYVAGPRPRKE
jgi:drug/metabolite transporter (DMT)-like permease